MSLDRVSAFVQERLGIYPEKIGNNQDTHRMYRKQPGNFEGNTKDLAMMKGKKKNTRDLEVPPSHVNRKGASIKIA